jgi:hypothetical protein
VRHQLSDTGWATQPCGSRATKIKSNEPSE